MAGKNSIAGPDRDVASQGCPYNQSRIVTVKSDPGLVPDACGTDITSRPILASALSGVRPRPSTTFETVAPAGIDKVEYGAPFCVTSKSIDAPFGAAPTFAKTSRTEWAA